MDLKCHEIKMTLAVHEIGRINQGANLEGVHDGQEERVSLSSGLPEIWKQHVTHLATFMPVGSAQTAQWTISWHPNLPKLVWSLSLSLFPFRHVDFIVWIRHYGRALTSSCP